jgi:hypothetical protein
LKEKKRKFYGNRHVKVEELPDSEASKEEKIAETSTSSLTTASDEVTSSSASEFRSLPASKRKLDCDLSSVDGHIVKRGLDWTGLVKRGLDYISKTRTGLC